MFDERKNIIDEIGQINQRLERLEEYIQQQSLSDPLLIRRVSTPTDEDNFRLTFRRKYPGFIPRLRELLPTVTPGEEQLCMMIRLNLNIREIANLLNIDVKSVHTARARLKRKVKPEEGMTIDEWVKQIDG